MFTFLTVIISMHIQGQIYRLVLQGKTQGRKQIKSNQITLLV